MSAESSDASRSRAWADRGLFGLIGVCYLVVVLKQMAADGGRESALFYGPIAVGVTFPILIGIGKLAAAGLHRIRALGAQPRRAIVLAPTLLLSGLLIYETFKGQTPLRKFERLVADPAPPSVRVASAYTYNGFNYRRSAFHFSIAPADVPKLLASRPYRHEIDPAGFDLAQVRDEAEGHAGCPIPPLDFQAVHRYRGRRASGRYGSEMTLYGDAAQTEFFAYGYAE